MDPHKEALARLRQAWSAANDMAVRNHERKTTQVKE